MNNQDPLPGKTDAATRGGTCANASYASRIQQVDFALSLQGREYLLLEITSRSSFRTCEAPFSTPQPQVKSGNFDYLRNCETLRSWFSTSSSVYGLRRNITFLGAMLANVYVNYSCCATFKANLGCKKWTQLQFEAHGKQIHACIRGERPAHNPNCFQQFRSIESLTFLCFPCKSHHHMNLFILLIVEF